MRKVWNYSCGLQKCLFTGPQYSCQLCTLYCPCVNGISHNEYFNSLDYMYSLIAGNGYLLVCDALLQFNGLWNHSLTNKRCFLNSGNVSRKFNISFIKYPLKLCIEWLTIISSIKKIDWHFECNLCKLGECYNKATATVQIVWHCKTQHTYTLYSMRKLIPHLCNAIEDRFGHNIRGE